MKQWAAISKTISFDAGHRVPRHESKCYSIHGHHYVVEVCCRGTIIDEHGAPDEGMLIDFSELKMFMVQEVEMPLDHACILYRADVNAIMALQSMSMEEGEKPQKVVEFPYIPTAENIARWAWEKLHPLIEQHFRANLVLDRVIVWETPTSKASYPEVLH